VAGAGSEGLAWGKDKSGILDRGQCSCRTNSLAVAYPETTSLRTSGAARLTSSRSPSLHYAAGTNYTEWSSMLNDDRNHFLP
jgi:hypothetical protein